jgi:hypothetical protein
LQGDRVQSRLALAHRDGRDLVEAAREHGCSSHGLERNPGGLSDGQLHDAVECPLADLTRHQPREEVAFVGRRCLEQLGEGVATDGDRTRPRGRRQCREGGVDVGHR